MSSSLEMFVEACGAPGPLLLDVKRSGGEPSRRHTLDQPFALIGRDKRSDLRLCDARVALRHAYLQVIAGRPFVVDLGSRAGTLWQGQPCRTGWLGPADTLGIGGFSVGLARGDETVSATAPATDWDPRQSGTADRLQFPAATVEYLEGNVRSPRWQLDSVLTLVGRNSSCQLRLPDSSVSPYHCALLLTAKGLWMVDLLGREGVWVNGRRLRWAQLEDGASLQVGRFPMRVWYQPAALAAPIDPFRKEPAVSEPWLADAGNLFGGSDVIVEKSGSGWVLPPTHLAALEPALPFMTAGGFIPGETAQPFAVPAVPLGNAALPPALLQHLAALQQGMMTQFHQSLMMMFQMLTAMRHEEMELLREVLRRVGGLTREVRETVAEGKKRTARRRRNQDNASAAPALRSPPSTADHSPVETSGASPDNGCVPLREAPPTDPAHAAAGGDPNFHAWLSGRIATLEKERQGAWQKLLNTLLGK